jgi:FkbM family methyltransferase
MKRGMSPFGFECVGYFDDPNSITANTAITGDLPEEECIRLFRFFLPRIHDMVDVGANTGLYGLLSLSYGIKTTLFEPQQDCCDALRETIRLNYWSPLAKVVCCALGKQAGKAPFYVAKSGSSLIHAFTDYAPYPKIEVPVDTLDSQAKALYLTPDFIKIDVEGAEQDVLEGGEETIRRYRPVMLIELVDTVTHGRYRNPNYSKTLLWLAQRNYEVLRCTLWTLRDAFPIKPFKGCGMYLAYPAEMKLKRELLWWMLPFWLAKIKRFFLSRRRMGRWMKRHMGVK